MIERIIENWLTSANERQYQLPFCQLLSAEGESVLDISTHHPHERGKDILTVLPDGTVRAYQLKAGRIDLGVWRAIKDEIDNLVELPVEHPSLKTKARHQPVLVTNGDITPPVIDQIRLKNEAFRRRRLPRLHLVVRGELLRRFARLHGHYLPRKPPDFARLLRLISRNGASPLDKETLSALLPSVLPLDGPTETARNAERAISSAALMMSYILGANESAQNHWAIFEGWVMMAAYALATAERNRIPLTQPLASYDLCLLGARRALDGLAAECRTRQHFMEGDLLTDGHFFRCRLTLLIGLLSAWGLAKRGSGENSDDDDFAVVFVKKHLRGSMFWGESAVPFYVLGALFLEKRSFQGIAETAIANVISTIATQNSSDTGTGPGMPNPYYSPEQALRLPLGLDPDNLENFLGFAYNLTPLIDFLARRWRRQELSRLWYSITRISMQRFQPEQTWQWLTWHADDGNLISTFAKEPQECVLVQ